MTDHTASQNSLPPQMAKPIDQRMAEAEQRIAMLENALRNMAGGAGSNGRLAAIEKYLTEKLGADLGAVSVPSTPAPQSSNS